MYMYVYTLICSHFPLIFLLCLVFVILQSGFLVYTCCGFLFILGYAFGESIIHTHTYLYMCYYVSMYTHAFGGISIFRLGEKVTFS